MITAQRDMTAARAQLMRDTLCTCIEGGSQSGLVGQPVRRDDPTGVGWYYAGIESCYDGDGDVVDNVTLATIELGYRRLIDGSVTANRNIVAEARRAFLDPDDGDIDAKAADVILQAGLFGSVLYA